MFGILEEVEDEAGERLFNHGTRELPSVPLAVFLVFVTKVEDSGLAKVDEAGLGLYEIQGLGWWDDERGLGEAEGPTTSLPSAGLHPCTFTDGRQMFQYNCHLNSLQKDLRERMLI